MVLGHLRLVLNGSLKVSFVLEQPVEDALLNLLVIFFLEEVVMEELHRAHDKQLASLERHVEGANWAVRRETNRARRQESAARLAHIERRAIGVDELEPAMLIAVVKLIFSVAVLLRVLARLVLIFFLSTGSLGEFIREAPIANVGLLGMEVLVEGLPHNAIGVDADADLLEHGVDVGSEFGLAALIHHDDTAATLFDVATDILQLLCIERETGSTEQEHVALLKAFECQLSLVDFALVPRL